MTAQERDPVDASRSRLKELTALLADHAEDTMDSDDVDQVRGEIIALYDALAARLEAAEGELRAALDRFEFGEPS